MQTEQAEALGSHAAVAAAAYHLIPNRQAQQPAAINMALKHLTHDAGVGITGHDRYPIFNPQTDVHTIQWIDITAHHVGEKGRGRIAQIAVIGVITGIAGPAQAVGQRLCGVRNARIPA